MRNKVRSRARPSTTKGYKTRGYETAESAKMTKLIDQLAEFEKFRETILPAIRADLSNGLTAPELREKYAALVQARIITEALTTPDAGKAATLSKDVLDRSEGKATERKEVSIKYSELGDEELDALLLSEEAELKDMNVTSKPQ